MNVQKGLTTSPRVVLLHGLLNRPFVMGRLKKMLEEKGFRVFNWGYASTKKTIQENASNLKDYVDGLDGDGPIHFVGFSMGGIIARYYLSKTPPEPLGRLVQIAPPNHGSDMVNRLRRWAVFRWVFGTTAFEQMRPEHPFWKTCGVPACDIGIVYGGRRNGEGFNPLLIGDNDGTVSAHSALLPEARDTLRVPGQHTLLVWSKKVAEQTAHFLVHGRFEKRG
jgi:pimeloyl-ACP methyl ester carboxylesterase